MNSHSTMNQGSKEYKDESYIDIGLFFSVLKKRLVWILAIAILFAVIAGVYTSFFVTPMYRTTVKFDIITEKYSSNAGSNFSINLATYLNDSEEMAKYVIEALNDGDGTNGEIAKKFSKNDIMRYVSASALNTGVVVAKVECSDAKVAFEIAKAVDWVVSSKYKLPEAAALEKLTDLSTSRPATSPSSPNLKSNIVVATVSGAVLSYMVFAIIAIINSKIYVEEDLKKHFNLPVLGQIPQWDDQ